MDERGRRLRQEPIGTLSRVPEKIDFLCNLRWTCALLRPEWSLPYLEKMVQCWREHIYQWTPEDMFGIPTGNGAVAVKMRLFQQLHDHLLGTNPELAETLTREVLKLGNITRDDLFARPGP